MHQLQEFLPSPFRPTNVSTLSCLPSFRVFLRVLLGLLIERLSVILKFLCRARLHRIIGYRLHQQLLRCQQHAQDLATRFPRFWFKYADTHTAVLIESDIRMPYAGLEGELWWFEWVVWWEDEQELELAALVAERIVSYDKEGFV